jgi:hypothetical protein
MQDTIKDLKTKII